jgi:hypothetical protein
VVRAGRGDPPLGVAWRSTLENRISSSDSKNRCSLSLTIHLPQASRTPSPEPQIALLSFKVRSLSNQVFLSFCSSFVRLAERFSGPPFRSFSLHLPLIPRRIASHSIHLKTMSSNFINGGGNSLSSQSDDDHKIHPTSQPIGADGHEKKASYDLEQGQTLPVVPQYNDDGTPIQTGIAKVEAAQSVWTPKTKWALYIGCVGLPSFPFPDLALIVCVGV